MRENNTAMFTKYLANFLSKALKKTIESRASKFWNSFSSLEFISHFISDVWLSGLQLGLGLLFLI